MKFNDLFWKITAILPEATFSEDEQGQLIIHTNVKLPREERDSLEPYVPEDRQTS